MSYINGYCYFLAYLKVILGTNIYVIHNSAILKSAK